MSARLSVVIPAHDEEETIDALLSVIAARPHRDAFEIVVVANGCSDATADRARAHPGVTVIEVATASKIAALEAGDAAATVFPRAYVDADVRIGAAALLALASALGEPGIAAAAPTLRVDASASSWPVRAHYRVWELSDYRRAGHLGSGVYALSAAGRARFGAWPDLIADDRFVQQLFAPAERATLAEHTFTVRAAATLPAHLRRSVRIARGNRELRSAPLSATADAASAVEAAAVEAAAAARPAASAPGIHSRGRLVGRIARRPALWPAFAVYCVTWTLPGILARRDIARGRAATWNRDDTSRAPHSPASTPSPSPAPAPTPPRIMIPRETHAHPRSLAQKWILAGTARGAGARGSGGEAP